MVCQVDSRAEENSQPCFLLLRAQDTCAYLFGLLMLLNNNNNNNNEKSVGPS